MDARILFLRDVRRDDVANEIRWRRRSGARFAGGRIARVQNGAKVANTRRVE
jgi:hypothetical protein